MDLKKIVDEASKHIFIARAAYNFGKNSEKFEEELLNEANEDTIPKQVSREERATDCRLASQIILRVAPVVIGGLAWGFPGAMYGAGYSVTETILESGIGYGWAKYKKSKEDEGKPWQHSALGDD